MPIRGEIRIVHFLPGRVRLRVAALKGQPQLAQEIQAAFDGLPGLTGIRTNTATGSVLITYDPHRILAEDGGERLRTVLQQQLPDLDVDQVIRALGGSPQGR